MAEISSSILQTLNAGSGMDTSAIIDALVSAERIPKESQLQSKIDASESQISGLGILKSALSSLKEASDVLAEKSNFTQENYVSARTSAFVVDASSDVVPGTYSVEVSQLATSQVTSLFEGYSGGIPVGFDSADAQMNAGNPFNIDISLEGLTHNVFVATPTPAGVAEAINAENIGLSARVISSGGDPEEFFVTVSGETGEANGFTIATDALEQEELRSAQDSILAVDGLVISRSSNSVDDAVPGASLELFELTGGEVSVTIARDTETVKQKVLDFVDTYLSFKEVIDALGDRDTSAEDGTGSLAGSSLLRTFSAKVRQILMNSPSSAVGSISFLSDLGIEFDLSGVLQVDEARLALAVEENFDAVADFFAGDSGGLATALSDYVTEAIAADGILESQVKSNQDSVSRYELRLEDIDRQMEMIRARYVKQFTAMEQAIDQFNSLRDSLTTQFENMPFTNKNK